MVWLIVTTAVLSGVRSAWDSGFSVALSQSETDQNATRRTHRASAALRTDNGGVFANPGRNDARRRAVVAAAFVIGEADTCGDPLRLHWRQSAAQHDEIRIERGRDRRCEEVYRGRANVEPAVDHGVSRIEPGKHRMKVRPDLTSTPQPAAQIFKITTDPSQDVRCKASDIFDAQVRVQLSRAITVVAQGKNLSDNRPTHVGPGFGLLSEKLENGRAYYISAFFKF